MHKKYQWYIYRFETNYIVIVVNAFKWWLRVCVCVRVFFRCLPMLPLCSTLSTPSSLPSDGNISEEQPSCAPSKQKKGSNNEYWRKRVLAFSCIFFSFFLLYHLHITPPGPSPYEFRSLNCTCCQSVEATTTKIIIGISGEEQKK